MAGSEIIPLGKHKGRDITSMNHGEVHVLWSAWNSHEHLKQHKFFKTILSELGRWLKKKENEGRPGASSVGRMPFGKHKGQLISDIPGDYLQWAAENIRGEIGEKLRDELQRRMEPSSDIPPMKNPGKKSGKKSKRDRAIPDDSGTHYPWKDSTGRVHMIPKDVQMDGREDEEPPFEVGPERDEMSELDREFRAMFC